MGNENQLHIFPTQSRDKHSKLVSFPIGAESLSQLLDGVPRHRVISCTFSAGNPHHDKGKELIYVLQVNYRKHARSHFDSGDAGVRCVYDTRWNITVHDVPAILRAEIKTALITKGLPEIIRPWLIENAAIGGKTGDAAVALRYNTINKVLVPELYSKVLPDKA